MDTPKHVTTFTGDPAYGRLRHTLMQAYLDAAGGKGAARHANGKPWSEQPMFDVIRMVGNGFALGQAIKKIEESQRMVPEAAIKELRGAICYLAAAIEAIEDGIV